MSNDRKLGNRAWVLSWHALKDNPTIKHIKYAYTEIFIKCLAILVQIYWLVLYFCYSHDKLPAVSEYWNDYW